jgi:hypothetical protein
LAEGKVGVEVFFHLKVFGFDVKGGLKLHLKDLLIDFSNKIAQFVLGGNSGSKWPRRTVDFEKDDTRYMDDDFFATEKDDSDDGESMGGRQPQSTLPPLEQCGIKFLLLSEEEANVLEPGIRTLKVLLQEIQESLDKKPFVLDADPTPSTCNEYPNCFYCSQRIHVKEFISHTQRCAASS